MAKHLAAKIAKLIGDFRTIDASIKLIEHEMEKRIIARHAMTKLDALMKLLPRYKNEIRRLEHGNSNAAVAEIDRLIARLRKDYEGSDMETARDAMTAHALKLDLMRIVETWTIMGETIFSVIMDDLNEIESELSKITRGHIPANTAQVDTSWPTQWRRTLGDPARPRYATIYPGLATAGTLSPVPGGHPAQDATIRAVGVATFLRQVRIIIDAVSQGTVADRLFTEIMLNDYIALWELLFSSSVQNEHGTPDLSVLEHWKNEGFSGAKCLEQLEKSPHPDFEKWRNIRNKITAHVDADIDIWDMDADKWPFKPHELMNEALRVIEAFKYCGSKDIRSKIFFIVPTELPSNVKGLDAQKGKHWSEA